MSVAQIVDTAPIAGASPLILVVEDEFLVRCVAADALRDTGYRVIEADNGEEARDMLVAGVPVDLVFSDVRMPGLLDGRDLLAWVRVNLPAIEVVLCSGHLAPSEALADGVGKFIAKPYRIDEVARRIAECLTVQEAAAA